MNLGDTSVEDILHFLLALGSSRTNFPPVSNFIVGRIFQVVLPDNEADATCAKDMTSESPEYVL